MQRRPLLLPVAGGAIFLAAVWSPIATGQEFKAGDAGGAVTSEPLGMSGWATAPMQLTAPPLGMTGWRNEPIALTSPPLGMTGWRSDPLRLATPMLGMTGWRAEPIRLTVQPLGMTGWRTAEPAPPPLIVCLGGQVRNIAARGAAPQYACSCPTGRAAQAMASNYKNTFQCIPDVVATPPPRSAVPPKLVCVGGAARNGECTCASGFMAVKTGPDAYRCTRTVTTPAPPQTVCAGGSVRDNACVCGPGYVPVKTGATSYRCNRLAVLPLPPATPKPTTPKPAEPTRVIAPQIACAGGVVRSNRCICPGGTALQAGVCKAPSVPTRTIAPQRVR